MNFLINSHRFLVSGGGFEPETSAWISRVLNSGNTVNATARNAVNAFVIACKTSGIWNKFRRVNLFCGDSFQAMQHPLVNNAGFVADFPSTFVQAVPPNYGQNSGLSGKLQMNTGLVPNTSLAWNSWHCGIYYISTTPNAAQMDLGCYGYPAHPVHEAHIQWRFTAHYSDNVGGLVITGDHNNGANPVFQLKPPSITSGFMLSSRQNVTSLRVRNTSGSVNVHYSLPVTGIQALPTVPVMVMSDGRGLYSKHTLGGYSIGASLTETEMTQYASIMETFQTALGRNRG